MQSSSAYPENISVVSLSRNSSYMRDSPDLDSQVRCCVKSSGVPQISVVLEFQDMLPLCAWPK
jgi:hypothetical protein